MVAVFLTLPCVALSTSQLQTFSRRGALVVASSVLLFKVILFGVQGFVKGTIQEVLNPNPCPSPPPHNPNPKPYNHIQPRPQTLATRYNPRPQPYNPIQPQPPTL